MARKLLSSADLVKEEKKESIGVDELKILVPKYKEVNDTYSKVNKEKSDLGKKIKDIMHESGLELFVEGDVKVTYKNNPREEFNEEKLIERLKELKVKGVIKKKEYVDEDALENAIYKGTINASDLADCRESKDVYTLRVSNA